MNGSRDRVRFRPERHQHILAALRTQGRIDAAAVAAELGVTSETVRKDLIQLERSGLLRRVHGGAVSAERLSMEPVVASRTEFTEEKTRIARAALAHVPHGGSILIDAGSTTAQVADQLPGDIDLTVYTNTLTVALGLLNRPRITVYTLGGRLRAPTLAEVGDVAARTLAEINVDVAFLGTNGISLVRGLTTPDPEEAAVKRLMLRTAQRRILLADHSKVGLVRGTRHAELSDMSLMITDTRLSGSRLADLQKTGVEIEQV